MSYSFIPAIRSCILYIYLFYAYACFTRYGRAYINLKHEQIRFSEKYYFYEFNARSKNVQVYLLVSVHSVQSLHFSYVFILFGTESEYANLKIMYSLLSLASSIRRASMQTLLLSLNLNAVLHSLSPSVAAPSLPSISTIVRLSSPPGDYYVYMYMHWPFYTYKMQAAHAMHIMCKQRMQEIFCFSSTHICFFRLYFLHLFEFLIVFCCLCAYSFFFSLWNSRNVFTLCYAFRFNFFAAQWI